MFSRNHSRFRALMGAVLAATIVTLGLPSAVSAADTVQTVRPGDPDWTFESSGSGASGSFVHGPDTPPAGGGSVRQEVAESGDRLDLTTESFNGTALADLTTLGYSTFVTSSGGGQAVALNLSVDVTGDGAADDLLAFEPVYQTGSYAGAAVPNQCPGIPNCVDLGAWQSWDTLNGGWWLESSGNAGPPLITLADFITANPAATLATNVPAVRLAAGSGWTGFDGNVDAFAIGISGDTTTVDFEETPPTTVVVTPHEMQGWSTAQQGAGTGGFEKGPGIPPAGNGSFEQRTPNGGDLHWVETEVLDGTPLVDVQALVYSTYTNQLPTASAMQLYLDLNGNGIYEGFSVDDYLVYEPANNGGATLETWETWDASQGTWWSRKAGLDSRYTLAEYIQQNSTAEVADFGSQGAASLRLQAGSSGGTWAGYIGNVDAIRVNGTVYDLETGGQVVDCSAVQDDISAVQAAVNNAADGSTVRLKGTCDFSAAAAHGGDVASVAAAAVVIRPGSPVNGLTITSDGSPQSASVIGSGTQTAFFVAPGQSDVTIRGLRFVNFARPLVTANNTNTTFGGGTAVPDVQGNRIVGNASMNSAILAIGNQMGASGQPGQMTVGYGPAGQTGQPAHSETFTFPTTVTLSGFKALGNYISFNPPGVPDGSNRDVVGIDVRQRGAANVDDVEITHNVVGMFSSEFPIFNMNGVKVHALSPDTTPHITKVSIRGNNLGRLEEISNPSFPGVDPADIHAAGRAGIVVIHAGDVSVTNNGVRTRMSPTGIPMPGGGIILSDVDGGVANGNAVIVVADPSTESSDLGAIGVVDDVNRLFSSSSGGPASRDVLVTNNIIGTVNDSGAPVGAQRGILLNGVDHPTVTNNTVRYSSEHALNIGVSVVGPGSPSAPGPITLENPVTEGVACANSLDGTIDEPSEIAFNAASGSVNNAFPGGPDANSGNMACNPVVNVSDAVLGDGEDQTVFGNAWPNRPLELRFEDSGGASISRSLTAGANKGFNELFTAAELASLADGTIIVRGTSSDDLGSAATAIGSRSFLKDTTPPATPTIVTPAEGETLTTSTVTVSGTGEPSSTVTITEGGVDLGSTAVGGDGAWSVQLGFTAGTHVISATAADAAGNVSSPSPDRTFIVDADAPDAPVITTPVDGDVFTANPVTVAGTAEPDSTVRVIEGTDQIGSATADGAGAWSTEITFADGEHTITAESLDGAGNLSPRAADVTFLVDANAPQAPVITAPTEGALLNTADVDVSGTAEPGVSVTVLEAGSSLGDTLAGGDGSWSLTVSFADGPHTITAQATDGGGNASPEADPVTFTVDTQAPSAPSITSPTEGETLTSDPVTVSGTADPDTTVHVIEAGTEIGLATADGTGAWSVDITFADGEHTITAFATDEAGNQSGHSAPVTFTADAGIPAAPVITAPANGATSTVSTVNITGTAEAGTTVTVIEGSSSLGDVVAAEDGSWSLSHSFADGEHTISARATDSAGHVSPDATPVTFTVDASAPTGLTVSFEDDDGLLTHAEAGSVFLGGTVEPGAVVEVVVSDTNGSTPNVAGSTFGASNGTWRLGPMDLSGLSDGTLTATAVAIDGAGNRSLPVQDKITKAASGDSIFAPKVKIKDGRDGIVSGGDPDGDQPGDPGFRADEDPSAIEIVVTHTGPQSQAAVTLDVVDADGATISVDLGTVGMNAPATTVIDMSAFPEGTATAAATVTVDTGSVQAADATTVDFNAATSEFTTEDGSTFLFLSIPFAPFGYSNIEFEGITRDTATPIRFVVLDFERSDGTGFTRTAPLDTYALESGWTLSVDRLPPGDYTVTARSMDEAGHLETAGPQIGVSVLGLL